jgi:hypothetical protein
MAKFIVSTVTKRSSIENESEPFNDSAAAIAFAQKLEDRKFRSILVLRDLEGVDHPDNKGKYFLYQIIK